MSSQPSCTPPIEADGLDWPRRLWAALTLLVGIAVTVLDASMANVALPSIARSLSVDASQVVWVVMAYNLVIVVSLLPLSAMAERVGFRRMYVAGMVLLMLASVGAAFSNSLVTLIVARVFQGLASSMLMCLFGGLVRNIYPLAKLSQGISLNAVTVGVMAVLGPSLGAFILELASWPWIFLVIVPLCMASLFGVRFLPEVPRASERFDWTACLLSMVVFGLSLIGLDILVKFPLWALACFALVAVTGTLLLRRSLLQTAPLLPVDLLRRVPVAYAVGASFFSFAAQMSAFVSLPFYFQSVRSFSYADVGMLLGAWAVGVAGMAPMSSWLLRYFSIATLCAVGAGCMALGVGTVLVLPLGGSFAWLTVAMLLGGIGFGFFQTPNNRALLTGAPRHRSGAAGGLQSITRVFGQGFGTALVSVVFTLAAAFGPTAGVLVSIVCALVATAINIHRAFNPARDAAS